MRVCSWRSQVQAMTLLPHFSTSELVLDHEQILPFSTVDGLSIILAEIHLGSRFFVAHLVISLWHLAFWILLLMSGLHLVVWLQYFCFSAVFLGWPVWGLSTPVISSFLWTFLVLGHFALKIACFALIDSSLVSMLVYPFFNNKCKSLHRQTSELLIRLMGYTSPFWYFWSLGGKKSKLPCSRLFTASRCKYQEINADILIYCIIFMAWLQRSLRNSKNKQTGFVVPILLEWA